MKPKLLFVSSRYLFPLDSGGKIRTVNVLRGLMGGSFDITLASPAPLEGKPSSETAGICDRFVCWPAAAKGPLFKWSRMRHLLSRVPVAVATDGSAAGSRVIRSEMARAPDVVVVDFPHAAMLAPPPYPCASVMFTHNVEAEIMQRHSLTAASVIKRAIWRSQASKMERFESDLLSRFTTVIAVAERDKGHFERHYHLRNVAVIPTGVDLEYFHFKENPPLADPQGGTVVFTGSMDWMANIDGIEFFMDEVWPRVAGARPNARCLIVGRAPPHALVEKARARRLNWEFTGFVDDVRPFVQSSHVYVIPLRVGGGTRIKVYEAMAMGCPVISTRIGVEGLPVEHGRHCLEADTAQAMSAAVVGLLADTSRRREISVQARDLVQEHMGARKVAQVFEQICLEAVRSRADGRELRS